MKNETTVLLVVLGVVGFLLYKNSPMAAANAVGGSAPPNVPIGILPLVNGYFQGPNYQDSTVGLMVTPYYFPSGQIAYLMDGAGVQYDPATGHPLATPYPPLTS